MSTHETLLFLLLLFSAIACYKWNKYLINVHLELKVLGNWAQAIINHLYWAIFTCNKNGKELIERFQQTHISPKYILQEMRSSTTLYWTIAKEAVAWNGFCSSWKTCQNQKKLVADLEHMTEQVNSTLLEVFHAKKMFYIRKSTFFWMEKMVAGAQIAVLDHNCNINRSQVSKSLRIWNIMKRYVS